MNAVVAAGEYLHLSDENRVRTACYALIARLFHSGPDEELLASIELADELTNDCADVRLTTAWKALNIAAAAMDAKTATNEFDKAFVGNGEAKVIPYASAYLTHTIKEQLIGRLRKDVARIGLTNREFASEHEDHLPGLCEVMWHLITTVSNDVGIREQKDFFLNYLAPFRSGFCHALEASPHTSFYKHVARFTEAFLNIEAESFGVT
jgi:TorA maturation chaperone TorD